MISIEHPLLNIFLDIVVLLTDAYTYCLHDEALHSFTNATEYVISALFLEASVHTEIKTLFFVF